MTCCPHGRHLHNHWADGTIDCLACDCHRNAERIDYVKLAAWTIAVGACFAVFAGLVWGVIR